MAACDAASAAAGNKKLWASENNAQPNQQQQSRPTGLAQNRYTGPSKRPAEAAAAAPLPKRAMTEKPTSKPAVVPPPAANKSAPTRKAPTPPRIQSSFDGFDDFVAYSEGIDSELVLSQMDQAEGDFWAGVDDEELAAVENEANASTEFKPQDTSMPPPAVPRQARANGPAIVQNQNGAAAHQIKFSVPAVVQKQNDAPTAAPQANKRNEDLQSNEQKTIPRASTPVQTSPGNQEPTKQPLSTTSAFNTASSVLRKGPTRAPSGVFDAKALKPAGSSSSSGSGSGTAKPLALV